MFDWLFGRKVEDDLRFLDPPSTVYETLSTHYLGPYTPI